MKNFKGLAAAAAAGLISLSSMAAPVFAEGTAGETGTFSTIVKTPEGLYPATDAEFTYVIEPATDAENYSDNAVGGTVFNGTSASMPTISTARNQDNADTKTTVEYSSSTVTFGNPNGFDGAGVFKYLVKANPADNEKSGHKSVTLSDTEYELYVAVEFEGENKVVKSYAFRKPGAENEEGKVDAPVFEHTYSPNPLTISKNVRGNQGNKRQEFTFTVTVDKPVGQTFTTEGKDVTVTEATEGNKVTYTFKLSDSESLTINGLTSDDVYKVKEDAAGYVASYKKDGGDAVDGAETPEINAIDGQDETVAFTNTKDGTVPTGILMTAAPYVAVVGLGGAFAGMFFRRKRED